MSSFSTYSRAMYFMASSAIRTGKEIFMTTTHSAQVNGQMLKTMGIGSTYRMKKWRDIERAMAPRELNFSIKVTFKLKNQVLTYHREVDSEWVA